MKAPSIFCALIAVMPLLSSAQDRTPHTDPSYNQRFLEHIWHPHAKPGKTFHVSKTGSDDHPGTAEKPFRTLAAARRAVRQLKKSAGLPKGGVLISIGPGSYHLSTSLGLGPEDSGTAKTPVIWKGTDRDQVIISGGTPLPAKQFVPVISADFEKRLHPTARGKLLQLDLHQIDLDQIFGQKGRHGQLAVDGHLLPVAQWPNRGYHHLGEILDMGPTTRWLKPGEKPAAYSTENPTGAKFRFREPLPVGIADEFQHSGDITAQGYLSNDWYFQREPIGKIQDDLIQLLHHTRYGVKNRIKTLPRRVRLVNVLSALDEPGEWYLDRQTSQLYLWPIPGFDHETSTVTVPGGKPLVRLTDASHIVIRDITFENAGKLAIDIRGGDHNLIAGAVIRNGDRRGIEIQGGKNHGLVSCEFYGLDTAFSISGGDIKTLTPCYHYATDNHIHGCRRRGYGLIGLKGVSIYFAHNLLHDMNGAVSFNTVDLLMEFNEFYNIGYEMGDFNVAYCGAKWHTMGNVVRHNFVHHLFEPGGHPIAPFRNDDGGAGLQIFGNVFYRAGRCAGQFHGPENDFQNNISLKIPILWWTHRKPTQPEHIQKAWDNLSRFGRDLPRGSKEDYLYSLEQEIGKKGWLKSPWKDAYPELARFIKSNPWAQSYCNVSHNYAFGVRKPFHIHIGPGTVEGMEDKREGDLSDLPKSGTFELPWPITMNDFVDPSILDFRFKPTFQPKPGFKAIPFQKIGLRQTHYRADIPDKTTYRQAVRKKFERTKKQKYDASLMNARYPSPAYLR